MTHNNIYNSGNNGGKLRSRADSRHLHPCFEKHFRLRPQFCNILLWLVSPMEVCIAVSSCCIFGLVIKVVKQWVLLASYQWNTAHCGRTWRRPVGGGLLRSTLLTYPMMDPKNLFRYLLTIHMCVFQKSSRRSCKILCLRPTASIRDSSCWCVIPSRRVWSVPEWAGGGPPLPQWSPCLMPTSNSTLAGESLAASAAWGQQLNTRALLFESYSSVWVFSK